MSGRLLDFSQYIGGADNVITVEMFPRSQKTYTYNFETDVSTYDFSADYQSILLDNVTYDRTTGLPNFTDTVVNGYFDNYTTINPTGNIDLASASTGFVSFTIPPERYTGSIYPSSRQNVVATVVAFQWDTDISQNTHRFLVLERWEPGVPMGDPADSANNSVTFNELSFFVETPAE